MKIQIREESSHHRSITSTPKITLLPKDRVF